ncbi:hypothetical protein L1047_08235 [Synechococcus sp. Nb3U1]|uniref:hypothetical protein n=1 Tax=Synechococcus sp. Nb3U1 TaxID=1914529 RepID=UPI001F1C705A|nr:hypothetical protein [Synechococcus sp. Nb3U1]MCF2971180.1 hypothetical protein [Synechococcus sp. Nb3U1]
MRKPVAMRSDARPRVETPTLVGRAARGAGMWAALLLAVLALSWGIPAQASCSYIPDYSTQEYRPIPTVTPTPSDLDPSPDGSSISEDQVSESQASESEDSVPLTRSEQGNWLQRLWRNLFG